MMTAGHVSASGCAIRALSPSHEGFRMTDQPTPRRSLLDRITGKKPAGTKGVQPLVRSHSIEKVAEVAGDIEREKRKNR